MNRHCWILPIWADYLLKFHHVNRVACVGHFALALFMTAKQSWEDADLHQAIQGGISTKGSLMLGLESQRGISLLQAPSDQGIWYYVS